jgi:hypothetical protein
VCVCVCRVCVGGGRGARALPHAWGLAALCSKHWRAAASSTKNERLALALNLSKKSWVVSAALTMLSLQEGDTPRQCLLLHALLYLLSLHSPMLCGCTD